MDNQSITHTRWNCTYHIVFIPKFRRKILYPMKRVGAKVSGEFEFISWEEAYAMIAENLLRIREKYGPQTTVFYEKVSGTLKKK